MSEALVAIVDPFSSGRHVAPYLKEQLKTRAIAVLSSKQLPQFYLDSFRPADFVEVLEVDNQETLKNRLCSLGVTAVLAGSEPGVLLADALAEGLKVPRNVFALSASRRNKFLMSEAIRKQKLMATKQVLAKDAEMAIRWAQKENLLPVVLKPKDSAGTDGVTLCSSSEEIRKYFSQHLGRRTMLGTLIDEVLVQEYLQGTEYVVDTVSLGSQVQVVAVWSYFKKEANGSPFVYDTMALLTQLTEQETALVDYTKKCLNALGIQNGPAHSEIMMTKAGPCFIETGARIHGGNGTLISGTCVGYNQIDRTALLCANPKKFLQTLRPLYQTTKGATEIFLISQAEGSFSGLVNVEQIKGLPSFDSMTFNVKPGQPIHKTTDLFTSPGRVILIGSPEQMRRDYTCVRDWEKAGAYGIS